MSNNKLKVVGDKPLWDEELRTWLETYIKEHPHHSIEVLARSQYIGVPRVIIEEYLEGTYFLPKESGGKGNRKEKSKIEDAIWRFRISIEGTARHNYIKNFWETRTWVQIQTACNTAIQQNAIVVIYGKPGIGKTRCLLEYTRRNTVTAPILVLCSPNTTPLYFVQKLARKIGLSENAIAARLEDNVAERLLRTPRQLIVDQANYLTEKSLGTICYLWEVARIPIILAGTKSLYELFITSRLTEDVRSQLSSRVAMHYPLTGLSLSEAKAIIERELNEYTTDNAVAQIYNITGGLPRCIEMLLLNLEELIKRNSEEIRSGKITLGELIAKAASRLMLD